MGIDPHHGDVFGAYRDVERPSEHALGATWEALERRIAAGDTGPRLSDGDEVAVVEDARGRGRAGAVALAVAAALGALWLVSPSATRLAAGDEAAPWVESEHQAVDGGEARSVVPGGPDVDKERPPRRAIPTVAVELPEPEPARTLEPELDPEPETPIRPRFKGRTKPPPTEESAPAVPALVDQARELQRIRSVLGHDPAAALRGLKAHRERAPDSPFAREREALMLLAECELGHADRVRDRVARVVEAQPGSPLAKRISEACGVDD